MLIDYETENFMHLTEIKIYPFWDGQKLDKVDKKLASIRGGFPFFGKLYSDIWVRSSV